MQSTRVAGKLRRLSSRSRKDSDATASKPKQMPMWQWIVIGLGSFLGLSASAALALARILGVIGRKVSEIYETELWATLPPSRAVAATTNVRPLFRLR